MRGKSSVDSKGSLYLWTNMTIMRIQSFFCITI